YLQVGFVVSGPPRLPRFDALADFSEGIFCRKSDLALRFPVAVRCCHQYLFLRDRSLCLCCQEQCLALLPASILCPRNGCVERVPVYCFVVCRFARRTYQSDESVNVPAIVTVDSNDRNDGIGDDTPHHSRNFGQCPSACRKQCTRSRLCSRVLVSRCL